MTDADYGYRGEAARFYDTQASFHGRADADFYADRATTVDGPVLELACGTGRVYLEALQNGVDVDGIDRSADMLSVLRKKAAANDLDPSVWQADMTAFAVDREYDLIYCPFNSLQTITELDGQRRMLAAVYDALAPGGQFVFDVFVPGFDIICEEYGEWVRKDVEYRGESHTFRTRTEIVDEVAQLIEVEYGLDREGRTIFEESHRLKLLPKREVELLAHLSPFDAWQVAGGFDGDPIEDGDHVQLWTMEKSG